jgi:hypothetical protein
MKSSKTVAITAVLFLILSTAFAMSGDGGQQPVKQEKGNEAVQVQSEQVQQEVKSVQETQNDQSAKPDGTRSDQVEKSGERVTVKDRLGFETGMSKEEHEKFKEEYNILAEKLGITKSSKYGYDTYFDWKVNLTKRKELEAMNVDLNNIGAPNHAKSHLENCVYSDIVLIGMIYDITYHEDTAFFKTSFRVHVEEYLKGESLIKDGSKRISIVNNSPAKNFNSSETELNIGDRMVFFLDYFGDVENNRYFSRSLSERPIINGKVYTNSGSVVIGDLQAVVKKMKKIIEINDSDNFYKRSYKVEE